MFPLAQALLGFRKTVMQLDGRMIDVVRDSVTPHGTIIVFILLVQCDRLPCAERPLMAFAVYLGHVMVVQGEGMPVHNVPSMRGNMEITFSVQFPNALSSSQKTGSLRVRLRALCSSHACSVLVSACL